jgi:ABC-type transport system involved in cytochrome bd biosynthesis fused ATPase/permease subunit
MLALAGLAPITAGALRVDGIEVSDLAPAAWRASVGWVTQAAAAGRASLRENVLLGRTPTVEAWEAAVALAGLASVAARLPQGWETLLGDAGAGLSGGELRRVACARALLGNPSLLVLDEPETHLDAEARAALVQLLTSARAGRTVLLFTHDPALAALADLQIPLKIKDLPPGEGTSA